MDKYDLVLDIIEHSEKYTSEQLAEIMSDPETREIYNLLCKTESVVRESGKQDVIAEWEKFSNAQFVRPRRLFSWFGSRAASIVAIVVSSIAAVAAGIAVTVAVKDRRPEPIAGEDAVMPSVIPPANESFNARKDSVNVLLTPVMFEDVPLEKIMMEVAEEYGVEVRFNDVEVASLHLYYKFDPSLPLNEVVEQLNTFEQINITRSGNILTID